MRDVQDAVGLIELSSIARGYIVSDAMVKKAPVRLLESRDFAVVLLDVRMPGLSGLETAHRIRQQPRSRHTPILFFSSAGMVYRMKVWRLPVGNPQARGKALINLLPLAQDERITTVMPMPEDEFFASLRAM